MTSNNYYFAQCHLMSGHLTVIRVDVPPSGYGAHVSRARAGFGQGDRLDVLVLCNGVCQLHQHDVVVQSCVVVTLMPVDGVHWHVLFGPLMHPDVVVTQDGNQWIRAKTWVKNKKKKVVIIITTQAVQKTSELKTNVLTFASSGQQRWSTGHWWGSHHSSGSQYW